MNHESIATVYHLFLALSLVQSFPDLRHKPLLVDMIAEVGNKTKVLYASIAGEHY